MQRKVVILVTNKSNYFKFIYVSLTMIEFYTWLKVDSKAPMTKQINYVYVLLNFVVIQLDTRIQQ